MSEERNLHTGDTHAIMCPHCHTEFDMDAQDYYRIVSQVRDTEFDREVQSRLALVQQEAELKAQARIQELQFALQSEQQGRAADLQRVRDKAALDLQSCRDGYEMQLRMKDEEVAFYRDFKARQSTKAIGESLELYCESQFNQVRAIAFPRAYFEKDNAVSRTGSKGDYIYREDDGAGGELISIMFEMKNEADTTDAKQRHKNADFFKELDKDRREKGCEYAILVTMLEADSDLYNQGIVDVSHRYPKMYVIRPQFFIPVIGFLRNAALKSLEYRQQVAALREQSLDVTAFEQKLADFKAGFERNYNLSNSQLETAIAGIDKAMDALAKVKSDMLKAANNIRIAGDKLDGLTIRKLTRGNAYMSDLFKNSGGGK